MSLVPSFLRSLVPVLPATGRSRVCTARPVPCSTTLDSA